MAKIAIVTIDGEISAENWQGNVQWVRDQLEWQGMFDEIQVTINSFGGDCTEGLGIYDLLLSYNKPITTIAISACCSVATVIFCAGSKRFIHPNTTFMVHQTAGEYWGSADEMRVYADWMDAFNKQISAIYEKATGKAAEIVAGWIGTTDTFMTAEEALTNGFATAIVQPIQARAFISRPVNSVTNNSDSTMKIIRDQFERLLKSVKNKLDLKPVKNEAVTLADGSSIDVAYSGDIAEGDAVTKDGAPAPDGDYTLADGTKITVKGGVIESIDTSNVQADGESTDPTDDGDGSPTDDAAETVTLPKAELDQLRADAALAKQIPSIQANLARLTKALGGRESGDVRTASGKTPSAVRANAKEGEAPKTAVERKREREAAARAAAEK